MKKKHIIIGYTALLLSACGSGSEGGGIFGGSGFNTDEVKVTKVVPITSEDNAPQCQVNLQVKYMKGDNEAAKAVNQAIMQRLFMMENLTMQQAVDSFANFYTSEYRKNMAPLYREDRSDEEKHAWYQYRYTIETDTQEGKDDCLVYLITLDMYEGGAHGIRQKLVMNFDAKTGKQIGLDDLFVQGYQFSLNDLLMEELRKVTKCKSLDELHEQNYLMTMDIYAPTNFILDDDEITFIYNPYEIATYDKGNIELSLSYSKLDHLLKHD
jgi:hypothetical protein